MKTLTILTATLIGGIALPTLAFATTTTMLGCEVKPVAGSNYVVKADPTCNFEIITGRGNEIDREKLADLLENGFQPEN